VISFYVVVARVGLDALRQDLLSELNARGLPGSEIPAWVTEISGGEAELSSRWVMREERTLRQGLVAPGDAIDSGLRPHVTRALTRLMDRERGESIYGLPTGFADLDELLGGLNAGELTVLAGRPSMGTSSLALNLLTYSVLYQGMAAAYFSTDLDSTAVTERLICSVGKLDGYRVRGGFLNRTEKRDFLTASEMLEPAQLFLFDSAESLEDLLERCRTLHGKLDLSLIVVDQPNGFVRRTAPGESVSVVKPEEVLVELRELAQELGVPLVMTAHLSPGGDRKEGPRLGDLKSGAFEVLADKILLLHRPEYYEPGREELRGIARVRVAKNKGGATGEIELVFVPNQMRFESIRIF
jgi:replicative DNA helicase